MADRVFAWLMFGCAALVVASLVWVLGDVVIEGLAHFSWSFLFAEPADAGHAGGIGPILVSTLWILLLALAVSLPVRQVKGMDKGLLVLGTILACYLNKEAHQHDPTQHRLLTLIMTAMRRHTTALLRPAP